MDKPRRRKLRPTRRHIAEYRAEPGTTEATLASLVSTVTTRTMIENEADTPGVNGVYFPTEDRIILFQCGGGTPAVVVALEEAGHSLHREAYIQDTERKLAIASGLNQWHPQAPLLIEWLEDARVYLHLKTLYPGVHDDLDYLWTLRADQVKKLYAESAIRDGVLLDGIGRPRPDGIGPFRDLLAEFAKIVTMYQTDGGSAVPETFPGVLDYCEKLLRARAEEERRLGKQLPRPAPNHRMDLGPQTVQVTTDRGSGYSAVNSSYGWGVLDERTLKLDTPVSAGDTP